MQKGKSDMNINELKTKAMQRKPASKRASQTGKKLDLSKMVRMNFNENSYGMSPKALEAIKESAVMGNRYDFNATEIKEVIAKKHGFEPSNVLIGAGSSALIDMLGVTFLEDGDEVVFCMPTFAAFVDMAYVNGATPKVVPVNENQEFDLEDMLQAINEKTKMVVVVNPNNPTSTYRSAKDIEEFIKKVPEGVMIVIDEAYLEYATAPDCKSMLYLVKEIDKPIIVLKTFSKIYGMAGVRMGYAIADSSVVASMNGCPAAWNISIMAQKAAIAALGDQEFIEYVKEKIAEGRDYITKELEQLGCKVFPSQTSFVYFDAHRDPAELMDEMAKENIAMGAAEYSRISVGTMEENQLFIQAMKKILSRDNS